MKHKLFIIIPLIIWALGASGKGIDSITNHAERAEKIWMNQGIHKILDEIRETRKISDEDFAGFSRWQFHESLRDKAGFFASAANNASFLEESAAGNYKSWLTVKRAYYFSKAEYFLEHRDSFRLIFEKAAQSMFIGGGCGDLNCSNIGFENNNFLTWKQYDGIACQDPTFGSSTCHNFTLVGSSTNINILTGTGFDPIVGTSNLPVVCPTGGTYSVRLENTANGGQASRITRTFKVDASNSTYIYKYAVVLEDPGSSHSDDVKPFFNVRVKLLNTSTCAVTEEMECANYSVIANTSNPELQQNFLQVAPGSPYYYKKWTSVAIPLNDYIGQYITVEFTVSDCAWGGHLGYAYLDGECLNSSPSIGPCVDGEKELTAPDGFTSYWWTGDDIHGENDKKKAKSGEGDVHLMATTITGCQLNYDFVITSCPADTPALCSIATLVANPGPCSNGSNFYTLNGTVTFSSAPVSGYLVLSNGYLSQIYPLPLTSPFNFAFNSLTSDGVPHTLTAKFYKGGFFSPEFLSCQMSVVYNAPAPCYIPPIPCENCLTSFNPEPGKYIISAWVKEISAPADAETYTDGFVEIKFSAGSITLPKMYGSGKIIDKWQRISYEFDIPIGATDIEINLGTLGGPVLFDDIRIHPANGSFVSYVYDPVSMKLVATLDDNNYATIYEYDNEGTLLRIKKETERGIMTIQENRENSPKR